MDTTIYALDADNKTIIATVTKSSEEKFTANDLQNRINLFDIQITQLQEQRDIYQKMLSEILVQFPNLEKISESSQASELIP